MYSFQKLSQLSQGNNVQDAASSSIDDFLWRDTCVSSTQLNRSFWNKMILYPPWNFDLQEVFLSKTNSILTWKHVLDSHGCNTMVFFWEVHVFLLLSWIGLFVGNRAYLHQETLKLQEVFLLGNNMLYVAASNVVGLFGEIYVFFQLGWIGLFGGNRAYLHLEIPKLQEVFLSKPKFIITRKQYASWCSF
jgi:hypothetical protein